METGNSKPGSENTPAGDAASDPGLQFQLPDSSGDRQSNLKYFIIGAAALVVLTAVAIVVMRSRPAASEAKVGLTPEEKAYLQNISFADAKMSAASNFLGQRVIYLDAEISNQGTRAVKQVEARMEFTDLVGQVILRERVKIFPPASLPLKPGETRAFQLFFDRMPSEWNQAPPRITTVSVQF